MRSLLPISLPGLIPLVMVCLAVLSDAASAAEGRATAPGTTTNALTARAIMDRMIASSGKTNDQLILTNYHFVRWDVSEEIDKKGAVTKRRDKIYDHSPIRGSAILREVREDGKIIPKSETDTQRKQDGEERKARSERTGGDNNLTITADMIKRFEFELLGTTNLSGHIVHAIRFGPAAKQEPAKNMSERVIQKVRGKIYIDTVAFQIVRLEAELSEEIGFWGGMLGKIKSFNMLVTRDPVDGIWFNKNIAGEFDARAMFSSVHGRFSSTNSSFIRRDAVPQMKSGPPKP